MTVQIDVYKRQALYSDKASRPNTPVNVIVGALILKEALGDTDDELVEALMFDIRYQYALHTTSFEEQPLSDRTLSRFRARVLAYETEHDVDLIHKCVVKMAKEIAEFMNLSPNMQRMDSMMIAANIKNLSLLELFYTCCLLYTSARPILAFLTYSPSIGTSTSSVPFNPSAIRTWHPVENGENPF